MLLFEEIPFCQSRINVSLFLSTSVSYHCSFLPLVSPPAVYVPSLSFRTLVLLLFVPNRVARRFCCPTDRPRRLLYLYSGLRVLQERTCPFPRSIRETAIYTSLLKIIYIIYKQPVKKPSRWQCISKQPSLKLRDRLSIIVVIIVFEIVLGTSVCSSRLFAPI